MGGYGAGKRRTVEEEQEKGRRHLTKRDGNGKV